MTVPAAPGSVGAHDRSERDCSTVYYVGPCAHSPRPLPRPFRNSRISRNGGAQRACAGPSQSNARTPSAPLLESPLRTHGPLRTSLAAAAKCARGAAIPLWNPPTEARP